MIKWPYSYIFNSIRSGQLPTNRLVLVYKYIIFKLLQDYGFTHYLKPKPSSGSSFKPQIDFTFFPLTILKHNLPPAKTPTSSTSLVLDISFIILLSCALLQHFEYLTTTECLGLKYIIYYLKVLYRIDILCAFTRAAAFQIIDKE